MTVTYSLEVSTSKLATFAKLLFRWRGSVYKLMWREILLFLLVYYCLSFTYRFALNKESRYVFERLSEHCNKYTEIIPLTFVLGFYLNIVYERWWNQFQAIQWPDRLALYLTTFLRGKDDRGRLLRRTVIRYLNLSAVLGLRMISSAVLKRFPTMDHLIEAGFLNEDEAKLYESISTQQQRQWIPCQWASSLLYESRKEGRISNDRELLELVKEVNDFLERNRQMTHYDWISVPLVYTQVVTIAVYSFFFACVMGRQFLYTSPQVGVKPFDLYFPFFTVLQLMFYMGWLKVAEVAINPFGEDDDDFEVNFILERNLQISYDFVDVCYEVCPKIEPDLHWGKKFIDLPHTAASFGLKDSAFQGSTVDVKIAPIETEIVIPEVKISEDEEALPDIEKQHELGLISNRRTSSILSSGGGSPRNIIRNLTRNRGRRGTIAITTRPVTVSRNNSTVSEHARDVVSVSGVSPNTSGDRKKFDRSEAHSRSLRKLSALHFSFTKPSTSQSGKQRSVNFKQQSLDIPPTQEPAAVDSEKLAAELFHLKRQRQENRKLQRQDQKVASESKSDTASTNSLETIDEDAGTIQKSDSSGSEKGGYVSAQSHLAVPSRIFRKDTS